MKKVEFNEDNIDKINIDDVSKDSAAAYYDDDIDEIYVLKRSYNIDDHGVRYVWVRLDKLDTKHEVVFYFNSFRSALLDRDNYDVYVGDNLQDLIFEIFDKVLRR